jgi:S-adenosylmethionine synthetase
VRLAKVLMSNAVDYRFVKGSRDEIKEKARQIAYACLGDCVDGKTEFLFNPTGEWQSINSCSAADSVVTGRKLVVQFSAAIPAPSWAAAPW